MKRIVILLTLLIVVGMVPVVAVSNADVIYQDQEEELIPTEDSVSIDDMDPIFYDAEEDEAMGDEKSGDSTKLIIGIVGGVILLGLGFLFISRSRSKKEE